MTSNQQVSYTSMMFWRDNQSCGEMVPVWVPRAPRKLLDTFWSNSPRACQERENLTTEVKRCQEDWTAGWWKAICGRFTVIFYTFKQWITVCSPICWPIALSTVPVLLEWSSFKRSWIVASRRWRTWKLRWSRLLQWKVNGCEHGFWVGKHGKTCDMGVWSDRLL